MLRWLGAAKRKQNQLQQRNQTNSELSERRTDDLSEASPMNENNSEQIVQSSTSEENHCSSLSLQVAAAIKLPMLKLQRRNALSIQRQKMLSI